jgi:hypothetical protein
MSSKAENCLKMDASAVIAEIVSRHPEIARIRIFVAHPAPLVQERLHLSSDELSLTDAAMNLKEKYNLPFWDGILLSCFRAQQPPLRLLREAAHHNESSERTTVVERKALTVEYLQSLTQGFTNNRMLAVSSRVELFDGSQQHLPMLDFHCPASPETLRLSVAVARELGVGDGFMLESGDSFHFYGSSLIADNDLMKFLGRALLYAPIIDRAWVAHQIIESTCALRISARSNSDGPPFVVARVTS